MWGIWVLIAILLAPALWLTVRVARRRGLLPAALALVLAAAGAWLAVLVAGRVLSEALPLALTALLLSALPAAGPAAVLLMSRRGDR